MYLNIFVAALFFSKPRFKMMIMLLYTNENSSYYNLSFYLFTNGLGVNALKNYNFSFIVILSLGAFTFIKAKAPNGYYANHDEKLKDHQKAAPQNSILFPIPAPPLSHTNTSQR